MRWSFELFCPPNWTASALFMVRLLRKRPNKETIEASFWYKYKPLLEAKDKEIKLLSEQKEFYSQQIEVIRKDNTRLLAIVENGCSLLLIVINKVS